MALISTLNGTTSDSYVATVAEAETIAAQLALLPSLGVDTAPFLAATDAAQEFALKLAADRIDQAPFVGIRTTSNQAREWGRVQTGKARFENVIPDVVKQAQVAEACTLMSSITDESAQIAKGVASFTVEEESVTFHSSAFSNASRPYSAAAEALLASVGLASTGAGSVYMPRR